MVIKEKGWGDKPERDPEQKRLVYARSASDLHSARSRLYKQLEEIKDVVVAKHLLSIVTELMTGRFMDSDDILDVINEKGPIDALVHLGGALINFQREARKMRDSYVSFDLDQGNLPPEKPEDSSGSENVDLGKNKFIPEEKAVGKQVGQMRGKVRTLLGGVLSSRIGLSPESFVKRNYSKK